MNASSSSGETARAVSSFRPGTPVVGATHVERTFHQLSMSWGIIPCMASPVKSGTELYSQAVKAAVLSVHADVGDIITVTAGMPVGRVSYTNTLRVIELQDAHIRLALEE
ncbi:MAG: pyruvate kinase alpha/beta domain-containing protein [Butyricicoccus sp.]